MSGPLPISRLDLLAESMASGLIQHYEVRRPPVPVFEMVRRPPAGLERHISLCLALPYSDAIYLRLLNGQGTVFVNPRLPWPQQRLATAKALLLGLFNSPGGHALGLGLTPIRFPDEISEYFARCLLIPVNMLPAGWAAQPILEMARLFEVPPEVMAARVAELDGRPRWDTGALPPF